MLDVANGSIGMLQAKVELHSTQYGARTAEIDGMIDKIQALLAVAQQGGARQQTEDDAQGVTPEPGSDNGPPNYQLHTPTRERNDSSERGPRVHKLSLDKLGLKMLSDESKFRTWIYFLPKAGARFGGQQQHVRCSVRVCLSVYAYLSHALILSLLILV